MTVNTCHTGLVRADERMRRVLDDGQYFVALISDKDQDHPAALAISQALQGVTVATTEEVLMFSCDMDTMLSRHRKDCNGRTGHS